MRERERACQGGGQLAADGTGMTLSMHASPTASTRSFAKPSFSGDSSAVMLPLFSAAASLVGFKLLAPAPPPAPPTVEAVAAAVAVALVAMMNFQVQFDVV